jgi:hexosaminidase
MMREILAGCALLFFAVADAPGEGLALIPRPAEQSISTNRMAVAPGLRIVPGPFANEAALLAESLSGVLGFQVSVGGKEGAAVSLQQADSIRPGGYRLRVAPDGVVLAASDGAGIFWGSQTLLQFLPPVRADGPVELVCGEIADAPRFPWRGFMLDASRHFQTVDYVKRLIDGLARYKMNVLHWHLVDDHGWRLEIKSLPRLTGVGAWREQPPIGRYGGFYTQDQIRDIVAYAAARHIAVVPEIEMPGHSRAAIASYPSLSCSGPPTVVDYFYDFPCPAQRFPPVPGANVLCASRDETFAFVTNVLTETLALFPSKFIHVGGDEVDLGHWNSCTNCTAKMKELGLANGHALQGWFMRRVEAWLAERGRRLIGWDEILEGGLGPDAAVMSWRGEQGGIAAAKAGHDAVMSPGHPLYFDHGQSEHPGEPSHWPGTETLEAVYRYEPIPAALTGEARARILGPQANLWSCFTHTEEKLDLQTYPRLLALSEIGWTAPERKDWGDFQQRLETHRGRLDALHLNQWREPRGGVAGRWSPSDCSASVTTLVWDIADAMHGPGDYEATFDYEAGKLKLDIVSAAIFADGKEVARDAHAGFTGWRDEANVYRFAIPDLRKGSRRELRAEVFTEGGTDSSGRVLFGEAVRTFPPTRPLPGLSSTTPVTQDRDRATYNWATRHQETCDLLRSNAFDVIMIGDSITHYWAGEPKAPIVRDEASWRKAFEGLRAANLGFGWDRTENVLWRLAHGALDGPAAKAAVILIGTNNLGINDAEEVAWGIEAICRAIHAKWPATRILLLGILPRADEPKLKTRPDEVNFLIETRLHDLAYVDVYDAGNAFRDGNGAVRKDLFTDGLHPNPQGYGLLAEKVREKLGPLVR